MGQILSQLGHLGFLEFSMSQLGHWDIEKSMFQLGHILSQLGHLGHQIGMHYRDTLDAHQLGDCNMIFDIFQSKNCVTGVELLKIFACGAQTMINLIDTLENSSETWIKVL